MTNSIRLHSIKCLAESGEWSDSDEPYVLITSVNLVPGGALPVPDVRTFRFGPWEMDAHDVIDVVVEPSFWGTASDPVLITNTANVVFVVTVMENDQGKPGGVRALIQSTAIASLGGSATQPRAERVSRLLNDIADAVKIQDVPVLGDDHVGTVELRLDGSDLIGSGTKNKTLAVDGGDEGSYELVFQIAQLDSRRFGKRAHLAAVSRHPERMEIWAVDGRGIMVGNPYEDQRWHGWYDLIGAGFNQETYVAAVSRHPERMELWAVGTDGFVRGVPFEDGGWRDWYELDGVRFNPGSPLAAVSRHPDRMEFWGITVDGIVHGNRFEYDHWEGWYPLGLPNGERFAPGGPIAAISRGSDLMEVWAVDQSGTVRGIGFDADGWGRWYPLDGAVFAGGTRLTPVSRHPDHMELLAIDRDGLPRGRRFDAGWKDAWYTIPGASFTPGSQVGTVSRHRDRLELWAIGITDGVIRGNSYDAALDPDNWQGWYVLGGAQFDQMTDLVGVSRSRSAAGLSSLLGPELMEFWSIGTNGIVLGKWYDGQWHDFYPLRWSHEP